LTILKVNQVMSGRTLSYTKQTLKYIIFHAVCIANETRTQTKHRFKMQGSAKID